MASAGNGSAPHMAGELFKMMAGVDLALQLPFLKISESMGNHDSKIVDAGRVD
jgi:tripartite-type tricarboxylate transporter receptor subunit TctC